MHWQVLYDPDNGEPAPVVCDCDIDADHDGHGNLMPF